MSRGLLSGLVWGAILGAVGLGFVSLLSPVPPDRAKDVAAAIEESEAEEAPAEAAAPEPEPAPAEEPAPEPAPDAAPAEAEPEEDAATPAEAVPVVAEAQEPAEPPLPQSVDEAGAPDQEAEAAAAAQAALPEEPASPEAAPAPELATPLPPPPEPPAEPASPGEVAATEEAVAVLLPEGGQVAAAPASPEVPAAMAPEAAPAEVAPAPLPQIVETPSAEAVEAAEPEAPAAGELARLPQIVETPSAEAVEAADPEMPAAGEPEAPAAAAGAEEDPDMPAIAEAGAPAAPEAESPAQPEEEAVLAESDQPTSGVGQPYGFGNLVPRVRINRLPTIGDRGASEAMAAEAIGAAAETGAPEAALERYAARFENPDAKPLFSLVVLDLGSEAGGLDQAALADFPFPVSFAIRADRPDADEAAQAYRKAGFEVVMVAGELPRAATPADMEVSFEAFRAALPETVAVLDAPEGGFQGSRPLATQVVAILGAEGQGLLTHDRGLNSAEQIAQREGVPSATVFRDLDPEPQDADSIRRTLDRAALRAVQEGRVIVLARSRPDTVSALFAWALEGRAESVALAPVSAVLKGQ